MQPSSTQQFIDIAGIQEGVVILKNGGYRMIFSVSAINFSLKSEEEQNSLIFQYQSFLNSLHFPVQIVMRSKRLDLNPYIKKVIAAKDKQQSELIKMQTEDYVDFISQLINLANIMKKTFYVVVSYDPVSVKSPSVINRLFKKSEASDLRIAAPEFKKYRTELAQRASSIASGLGSMGLHSVQLTTEEIIELFYNIYNPGIADKEKFTNAEELTSSFVADEKERPKNAEEQVNGLGEKDEKEEVIDNSGIVEEKYKQEAQIKQMTADNEGERQIATKGPQTPQREFAPAEQPSSVSAASSTILPPTTTPTQVRPPVPNGASQPNINQDINKAQAQSVQSSTQPPTAPPSQII